MMSDDDFSDPVVEFAQPAAQVFDLFLVDAASLERE